MSVQTDPLPPAPEHTPPLKEDENTRGAGKFFNQAWTRWFVSLRDKINVLNDSLVNLASVVGTGFLAKDGPVWNVRTFIAGAGLGGSNLDGAGGDPELFHADTSTVVDFTSNNSDGVVLQDITFTFDTFGHVLTATVGTVDLDLRYALATVITQTITNGDTTHSPSGDVVFDALELKAPIAAPVFTMNSATIQGNSPRFILSELDQSYDFFFLVDNKTWSVRAGVVGNQVFVVDFDASRINLKAGSFAANIDNAASLGLSAGRWSVVYSATGAINTSDAREKTEVATLTPAELAAAKDLSRAIGTYQWLAMVAEKGADKARRHAGLTVQRAIEILEFHGLDPFRYGFICYDEWEEVPEQRDEETGEVTQEYRPAGNRYSFRMDELAMFIARGLDARLAALEG